ncbi:nucleotidyltransferase family protein [Massilia sp. DJPM01]|uniref:nucleotidyltransferase family protein n=1 Tax=Massilia sp. DJPM01 TaxID=3024404 RepID=UPI00259E6B08|nr:nucleotidyltransferase family protein [Massilia sp. DJPM01]MDM5175741.1 nucleotidyltransferase family protein [Massilia sp. DJPM01]
MSALPRVLILAGGKGTRLGPVLGGLPKPMAMVGGRPFLAHLIERLEAAGFTEVTLSLGYQADCIVRHFGARHGGVALRHVTEPSALGTGGAIALALAGQGGAPWLVMNGDTCFDIDYHAFIACWRARPAHLAIALTELADCSRYGRVVVRAGEVVDFAEKQPGAAGVINAGLYLLTEDILRPFALPPHFSFETELLQAHCAALRPSAFVAEGYFIDIGVPEDLERARSQMPLRAPGPG